MVFILAIFMTHVSATLRLPVNVFFLIYIFALFSNKKLKKISKHHLKRPDKLRFLLLFFLSPPANSFLVLIINLTRLNEVYAKS